MKDYKYIIKQDGKHWFIYNEELNIKIYTTRKEELIGLFNWLVSLHYFH